MADFPGRPRVTKGALVVFATSAPVPTQLIVFPLNPDNVSRRFDLGAGAAGRAAAGTSETHTPATAPAETLTVSLELDATDDLEQPDQHPITVISGLLPVLSALEQLLYPSVLMTGLVKTLAAIGGSTITPATKPWIVFVWGLGRIVPVKVTGLTITEQAFDPRLNPISARAELQLTVLSSDELAGAPSLLQGLPTVHAVAREALSIAETAASVLAAPNVLPL
jgi:hypothetical protein